MELPGGIVKTLDRAGREAALLTVVEVGLGSILHGLHLPMSGQFLSLNQTYLLTRSTLKADRAQTPRHFPFLVSSLAAVLKSLSPAGKKLTPMLAISMQGLLYSVGTLIFGLNLVGALVGAALSGVWAFAQPLLIYSLIFGRGWWDALNAAALKATEFVHLSGVGLWEILGVLVAAKTLAALMVTLLAWKIQDAQANRYEALLLDAAQLKSETASQRSPHASRAGAAARAALRDLAQPFFLLSLGMTFVFFYFSESTTTAQLVWSLLRPLAVGFGIFFLLRWFPIGGDLLSEANRKARS